MKNKISLQVYPEKSSKKIFTKGIILIIGMFLLFGIGFVSAAPRGVPQITGCGGKKLWNFNNHTVNISNDLSLPSVPLIEEYWGNVGGLIYGNGSQLTGINGVIL